MTIISATLCLSVYLIIIFGRSKSESCPAPSPCVCSGIHINCNGRNLTSVPPMISNTNTTYRLYLGDNPDLVITDNSFQNIKLEYLKLNGPLHTEMSRHALANQRNTLKKFYFWNTALDMVPPALAECDALEILDLRYSTIQHWDERLMLKLGWSIVKLNIAYTGLTAWPNWLRHMWNLVDLSISGNNIPVIPHDAFNTFGSTLSNLDIESITISDMPVALTMLHNLAYLTIGGTTLTDSSFYDTWLPSHNSSLAFLRISSTKIGHIPLSISEHTSITMLSIHETNIKHVEEDALPKSLTSLTISSSLLSRIDGGICNPDLAMLNLGKNKITSIEKYDLSDCTDLKYLDLSDNSIDYISPTVFNHIQILIVLNLKGNRLVNMPVALNRPMVVHALYINNNPLECTCEDAWFIERNQKLLNTPYFTNVYGECADLGIDLKDFKPHCPGIFIG